MTKPRLFVFGDSWSFNYFSKKNNLINYPLHFGNEHVKSYVKHYNFYGHWTDHLSNYYEIISFAEPGCSNEQILFQIGNLEDFEFKYGDRIIIIFSNPIRFNIFYKNKNYNITPKNNVIDSLFKNNDISSFIENQHLERNRRWKDDSIIKNEKKFINTIKHLLYKWNPIFFTWTTELDIKSVECIPFSIINSSIKKESFGHFNDWHLGVMGNYMLFKLFAEKLNLNISDYLYKVNSFKLDTSII